MKIRVGVVGPGDSVGHILALSREYSELEMIPYIYKETKETEKIIRDHKTEIDLWFFSGQAPYFYARSKGLIGGRKCPLSPSIWLQPAGNTP